MDEREPHVHTHLPYWRPPHYFCSLLVHLVQGAGVGLIHDCPAPGSIRSFSHLTSLLLPSPGALNLPLLHRLQQRGEEGSEVQLQQEAQHGPHAHHQIHLNSSECLGAPRLPLPSTAGTVEAG